MPSQAPVPVPAVQPRHCAHPYWAPHVAHEPPAGVPAHVPGVLQPAQLLQPGQVAHDVMVGVPVHVGPVLNTCGGGADAICVVPQQIRAVPEQSPSLLQDCGQVCWQMPSQQSSPVAAQSADAVHAVGHGEYWGLRQRPDAVTLESMAFAVVQQTSPWLV